MEEHTGDEGVERAIPSDGILHEQLLEVSPVPLAVLDGEGRVVLANERAERELGLREDELLGLSADDSDVQVLDEDGNAVAPERTVSRRVLRTGEPVQGERIRVVLPDERELWLSVSGGPLADGSGAVTGVVLAFEDITERKQRERELQLKNRRLEDLASVISHEFRNPLQIARGFTDMARRSGDPEHFGKVEAAHERMEALVDRLLELSTASTAQRAAVDPATAAERAWSRVGAEDATLTVEEGLTPLAADEPTLVDLFEQLLENSVEHGATGPAADTPETDGPVGAPDTSETDGPGGAPDTSESVVGRDGGGVSARVGPLSGDAGFYVSDDGPGIPESEWATLFEATPSSRGELGSFGLEVVRIIAEEHGWTVGVTESEAGGARVEIRVGPSPGES